MSITTRSRGCRYAMIAPLDSYTARWCIAFPVRKYDRTLFVYGLLAVVYWRSRRFCVQVPLVSLTCVCVMAILPMCSYVYRRCRHAWVTIVCSVAQQLCVNLLTVLLVVDRPAICAFVAFCCSAYSTRHCTALFLQHWLKGHCVPHHTSSTICNAAR